MLQLSLVGCLRVLGCALTLLTAVSAADGRPDIHIVSDALKPWGGSAAAHAEATAQSCELPDLGRTTSMKIRVKDTAEHPWDIALGANLPAEFATGDIAVATVWARSEGADGDIELALQLGREPWTRFGTAQALVGRQWRKFTLSARIDGSHPADSLQLSLNVGMHPQTIEVAGVAVTTLPAATASPAPLRSTSGAELAGFSSLVPGGWRVGLSLANRWGGAWNQGTTISAITDGDPRVQDAVRIQVPHAYEKPYDASLGMRTTAPVSVQSSIMLARFWARAVVCQRVESSDSDLWFFMQRHGEPWTSLANTKVVVTKEWKEYFIPIDISYGAKMEGIGGYGAGEVSFGFNLGLTPQTVDIAGFDLLGFRSPIALSSLPDSTHVTYPGREAGASWRMLAEQRIEKLRKGDLTVTVTSASGAPVSGATVEVAMQRHAFPFGTAVAAEWLVGGNAEDPDRRRYRDTIAKLFNTAVIENDMKWRALDNGPSRQAGLAACDWLRDNRIRIRGHNLMWPQWKWVPFLEQFKDRPAELTRIIDAHLDETLAAFKGRTFCWDVVNEADPENDLTRVIGTPTYDSWWKRCKQLDPGALTISNGGWPSDDLLAYWDEHRLPVDGVGYEAHIGGIPEPPEDILRQADRVAKHGKEIQVTEFDNTIIEPGLQSDYMRDFMTACFSHPSVTAIVMWGFWDGNHWLASAPLFNKDWTLKPGGTAWMDLVFSRWWTRATGATDAAGRYRLRGFLGDYAVTVTTHGTSRTTRLSLPREGAQATITIP